MIVFLGQIIPSEMMNTVYEYHILELRDAVIDESFAVAKRKPEKNSGFYGIRTLVLSRYLCDTGAAL